MQLIKNFIKDLVYNYRNVYKLFPKIIFLKLKIAIFITLCLGFPCYWDLKSEAFASELASKEEILKADLNPSYLRNFSSNPYILGPGDTIKITISSDYPELTRIVTINGEGTIYMPELKNIYVKDLTLNELNFMLNESYSDLVKYPEVESKVLFYRPINVLVDGEVENPGLYKLSGSLSSNENINRDQFSNFSSRFSTEITRISDIESPSNINFYFPTVFDALKISGGITRFSDLSNVEVIRKNTLTEGGGKIKTNLNFIDLILKGDDSQNIRIYDGDLIVINKLLESDTKTLKNALKSNLNPKYINVFVAGRVNQPGLIKIGRSSSLNDAIDLAGGAKVIRGPIRFLTFNNEGTVEKEKFDIRGDQKEENIQTPI